MKTETEVPKWWTLPPPSTVVFSKKYPYEQLWNIELCASSRYDHGARYCVVFETNGIELKLEKIRLSHKNLVFLAFRWNIYSRFFVNILCCPVY